MSGGESGGVLKKAVRALHRLVHPQYAEERARLDDIRRAVKIAAEEQQKQITRLAREMSGLASRIDGLARNRDLQSLDRRVEWLREASARQHRTLTQALKFAAWDEELRIEERRLVHRLERLRGTSRPILIGPWSGEVGFELLYWIPFVTWALAHIDAAPERVVVVSRGGPQSWYAHLGGRYADLLTLVDIDRFRAHTTEHKKQRTMRPFDREMVRAAIAKLDLDRPVLLHPGLMYRLFTPYWKQKATVLRVEAYTKHQRIAPPAPPELDGRLPKDYVAVRFYFSSCFPDTPENRAFADQTVRGLAESSHVVLLNTPFRVDDHADHAAKGSPRVHTVDDLMTPARNLDVQTAVIAGAKAFVGTYGGYSYLAPLCGVPSLAFYSRREEFFAHHLQLADRVFRAMNTADLVPIDVRDAEVLGLALGARLRSADLGGAGLLR